MRCCEKLLSERGKLLIQTTILPSTHRDLRPSFSIELVRIARWIENRDFTSRLCLLLIHQTGIRTQVSRPLVLASFAPGMPHLFTVCLVCFARALIHTYEVLNHLLEV